MQHQLNQPCLKVLGRYCEREFIPADWFNEKAFDLSNFIPFRLYPEDPFWSTVAQYVLSEEQQILVCGTSTILFAFCGTSLWNRPTWSYCGRMYPSPGSMRRIPHQAPTRGSAAAAGRAAVSHPQFVCTLSAGVSPPAMSFNTARWAGFFFFGLKPAL